MQEWPMTTNGLLALVGGFEWTQGCTFDATLLDASGGNDVVVLPTAAAYQHPERVALQAAEWFATLGAQVQGLMVVDRASANDPGMAAVVRAARFIYLAGGSPLHLKSVLKGSATFEAIREAWASGAVVAGSAAGAMVLTDPMVDPRGGALTVGLGLVDQLAVVPQFGDGLEDAHGQKLQRTVALAPAGLPVVGIPDRTALLRAGNGTWSYEGVAPPVVFLNGARTDGLGALER
jgi:cyanophycinase